MGVDVDVVEAEFEEVVAVKQAQYISMHVSFRFPHAHLQDEVLVAEAEAEVASHCEGRVR